MGKKKVGSFKFYIILGVLVVIFLPPFAKYQELRYKNSKLEERIESLKIENAQLAEEKRLLETDIHYVEKKAREKMGLVRKGEIVMKEVSVRK
ncbi:MAG: septum formation initiator family protein [Candidatus Omnitrophica bacterium]|nr:septum formation initiator family protein [Candidatus Omnitrophota bacterium]